MSGLPAGEEARRALARRLRVDAGGVEVLRVEARVLLRHRGRLHVAVVGPEGHVRFEDTPAGGPAGRPMVPPPRFDA